MTSNGLSRIFELQDPRHARLLPMEGLRGVAVTLVFLQHYGVQAQLIGLPPGPVAATAAAWRNYGNLGVELFFALSGYLIYGTLVRRGPRFLTFMLRRVQRIYPAFLVVFALMLALTVAVPIPDKLPPGLPGAALHVLGNLLLLPGLFPLTPIVTVAWSLSYEMFFYLATAAAVLGLGMHRMAAPRRRAILAGVVALFLAGMALDLPGYPVRFAPFFAGMLLVEGAGRIVPDWLALAAAPFGFAMTLLGLLPPGPEELVQAACFFALCAPCFRETGLVSRLMTWTPLRWLGNMSYSYYLVHGIVVRIACVLLARVLPAGMTGASFWLLGLALYGATLLAGAVLFILVEKPLSLRNPVRGASAPVGERAATAAPSPGS